jgi:adenylate cyclase
MPTHSRSPSQRRSYAAWLRLQPWYARVVPAFFGVALLLPVLALHGFVQAGREVSAQARVSGWLQEVLRTTNAPSAAARRSLDDVRSAVPVAFGAAVGATLVARAIRQRVERRRGSIRIT